MASFAVRSRLLHVTCCEPLHWEYLDDGVLLVEDGFIKDMGAAEKFSREGFDLSLCGHYPDHLLVPGFIDTHVHSPQIDIIGSYGEQLLDWLNKYTFPAEMCYADGQYAEKAARDFVNQLTMAGTTSAMVFATSHLEATDALFSAAFEKNMRLIAGKVLMDRNAPAGLTDTALGGVADSEVLIDRWHGKGRLGYAVTPRFAGTSSREQLDAAGRLHEQYPSTWVQSHLSENKDEVAWVLSVHDDARDYLDVYERSGLVTERAVFGHCIHLSGDEIDRMAAAGGSVAFCPSSNLFLGSGLLDVARLKKKKVPVGIATDVGAGTSLSMLRTLGEAYKVCQLEGVSLSAMEAFAMATLRNAEVLHLDDVIGNLQAGKEADFVLLDPSVCEMTERRVRLTKSIEEELFVYITLGDERLIAATYVNGEQCYGRAA